MSHSARLLRLTDQFIEVILVDGETMDDAVPTPLDGCVGTVQIFSDADAAVTAALTLTQFVDSPTTGTYRATLEGGTPPFSTAQGSGYYAKVIITAPADAVMIRRVHIVDG